MKGTIESLRFTQDGKRERTVVKENAVEVDFRAYTAMYNAELTLGRYCGSAPYQTHFEDGMLVFKPCKECEECEKGDCDKCQH